MQFKWKSMWQKKKKIFFWLLATLVFSINYLMVETILTQYLKVKDQIDIPPHTLGVVVIPQV